MRNIEYKGLGLLDYSTKWNDSLFGVNNIGEDMIIINNQYELCRCAGIMKDDCKSCKFINMNILGGGIWHGT